MQSEEPIDENISPRPPSDFDEPTPRRIDREEGNFNPGATGERAWAEEGDGAAHDEDEEENERRAQVDR